jgi:broad specificity phosphatase PhoE
MESKLTFSQEERERRIRASLPVELVFIRHAEPDWEAARRGINDPGLTEHGRKQARALARHLQQTPFAAMVCSPLQRARETAAAIAELQEIQPVVVEGLAEIAVPLQGSISQAEADAYFRSAAIRPLRQHWEGFPGGETFHAFHERVTAAIADVLKSYGVFSREVDGFEVWSSPSRSSTLRLALVGHGGTNSVALTHLLGIPPVPWEWIRFETPLAAYSVVGLRAINDQGHVWSLQQFGRRIE